VGARALAAGPFTARGLLHWLGALAVGAVILEIALHPTVLELHEEARNDLLVMHPNTLGCLFALLGPLFLAATLDRGRRGLALAFLAPALLGGARPFSRGGWLGLGAGLLVVALGGGRRDARAGIGPAAAATAAAVAFAAVSLSLGRQEADVQR